MNETRLSSTLPGEKQDRMAAAAAILSIVAFVVPIGIAALVLGHVAKRRIRASNGLLAGEPIANAALIISYVQLALLAALCFTVWHAFWAAARDFRNDTMVQRVVREVDTRRPLDRTSAKEEEFAAKTIVYELTAIEEQYYRSSRGYLCSVPELLRFGVQGSTRAEKIALAARVKDSAYMFEVSDCTPAGIPSDSSRYKLAAVPRTPRMPQDSLIVCIDQTGVMQGIRQGISLDCFEKGTRIGFP